MIEHLDDEQLNALADRIRQHTRVEDDADPARQHLEECSRCRDRFGRLAKLLNVAEAMPRRVEPPVDLWPSIRASIRELGTERPVVRDLTSANQSWHARQRVRVSLAAAAVVLMAILFGTRIVDGFKAGSRTTAVSSSTTAESPKSTGEIVPASTIAGLDTEDLHVEEELLAALELRRSALRPSTSAQIDSSLKVIDGAIAELEAARRRDPNNAAIRQLLAVSRARKLELLKQAQNAS
jgi:predicted anti-sigma-YlaC factor YlaD